jgi:D-alanyl-D-alanine carboxypeptidase (penicillin-binding protein 5/6)
MADYTDPGAPVVRASVAPQLAETLEMSRARAEALRESLARSEMVREARRRGRRRLGAVVGAGVVVIVLLVSLSSPTANREHLTSQHKPNATTTPSVAPSLRSTLSAQIHFGGKPAALPLPKVGEGAVYVAGVGVVGATARERSVPIASLTKIMTAYLVLKDHPLKLNQQGPEFVMTKADHEAWVVASESGDSQLEVAAGEHLSERQLLQALMIPSADNIADYLAKWDSGSIAAFVTKMNATAAELGLSKTHYADASGVNPGSRSTALDQARLAGMAMQNPVFVSIVDELHIRLPVTGEIWNAYNPAVGVDGIIGVKSGFTLAASVCLVTAAWRVVGKHRLLVISAVVGQPTDMFGAADEDEALLDAATAEFVTRTVLASGTEVGQALVDWTHSPTAVRIGPNPVTVAGWPGLTLKEAVVPLGSARLWRAHGLSAGSTVASLELASPFGTYLKCPAMLAAAIPPPPAGWAPSALDR